MRRGNRNVDETLQVFTVIEIVLLLGQPESETQS